MGTAAPPDSPARPESPCPPIAATQGRVPTSLLLPLTPHFFPLLRASDTFSKFSGCCCFLFKFLAPHRPSPPWERLLPPGHMLCPGPGRGRSSWLVPAAVRCGGAKEKSPDYGASWESCEGMLPRALLPTARPLPLRVSGL